MLPCRVVSILYLWITKMGNKLRQHKQLTDKGGTMVCQKEPCGIVATSMKYATVAFSVIGLWLSWFSMKVLQNEQTLIRLEERQKVIIQKILEMGKELRKDERAKDKCVRDGNPVRNDGLHKSDTGIEGR